MQTPIEYNFKQFLAKFPPIEMPITITAESHHAFSLENPPLPYMMIEQFISPLETTPLDEFTEIIPCLSIPRTESFHAIIYWKACLTNYQYILLTFTKNGKLIDKMTLCETKWNDKSLIQSVASIDEDLIIHCVEGITDINQQLLDPTKNTMKSFEILPTGEIIT